MSLRDLEVSVFCGYFQSRELLRSSSEVVTKENQYASCFMYRQSPTKFGCGNTCALNYRPQYTQLFSGMSLYYERNSCNMQTSIRFNTGGHKK